MSSAYLHELVSSDVLEAVIESHGDGCTQHYGALLGGTVHQNQSRGQQAGVLLEELPVL